MIDYDTPTLPHVCAECGAELMLTPSGHHFCADPSCTEGFGVAAPVWRFYRIIDDALSDNMTAPDKKLCH
ncbi:MAG TPA: hypothetical protein VI137_13540 [Pseudolabrys sp.]|jgi:hypothetical protein